MAYKYTSSNGADYFLHVHVSEFRGGRKHTVYFFSKKEHEGKAVEELPNGSVVFESRGIPHLTRKKVADTAED